MKIKSNLAKFSVGLWILTILAVGILGYLHLRSDGISDEQRQSYLTMAQECDSKASQAQDRAEETWNKSANLPTRTIQYEGQRTSLVEQAKEYQSLASEYRQQALKYRELVAK